MLVVTVFGTVFEKLGDASIYIPEFQIELMRITLPCCSLLVDVMITNCEENNFTF